MKRFTNLLPALVVMLLSTPLGAQETLEEVLERFDSFVSEGNYVKALEELEWARRAIEKAHHARIESLFPSHMSGFVAQEMERQEFFGIQNYSRRYRDASGREILVTLLGDGMGGAGFAALEQLARMLGAQLSAEALRIDGLGATLVAPDEEGNVVLTVRLESGATLQMRMPDGDGDVVLGAAREFGIKRLDDYLAGRNPEVKATI